MTNKPFALTAKEIKEIASMKEIQDAWGAEDSTEMEETLKHLYTVKFQYVNGSPGYVGDLFIIQPDVLGNEYPLTRLIRNREKRLKLLE